LKQLKPKDIVDSFVLPHGLKKADKDKADAELMQVLNKKRASISDDQKLEFSLLQFKFQLEDYIKSSNYSERFTFGYFLKTYLNILNKKNKEFADEIDVPQRSLSSWLNNHKVPDSEIFIRLEIHSNNSIPAINWLKVIEKGTEYRLIYNSALRQTQRAHVKKKLEIAF
jgi:hypothetical protein